VSSKFAFTTSPDLIRNCRRCSRELPPGALVCENCHALVHSEQLDHIAAEAKTLEEKGDLRQAREQWLSGLRLLPPTSKQAQWIEDHVRSLDALVSPGSAPLSGTNVMVQDKRKPWQRKLLSLGFLLSFLAFAAIYSSASGAQFGIGFAVLILIHEMGHYVDIRRRGLPADMPIFLPGLGAYVRWRALGVPLETRAAISLAGPLAGFLAAAACALLWLKTHDPYWIVLARVGAALNLLNLIPVWILDGGHAALALSKGERVTLLISSLGLWIALRENALLLVAAGAAYRAFMAKDLPARPSWVTTAYFIGVVTALAVILHVLPGHGFGAQ
jgi:Zn-dependent protease